MTEYTIHIPNWRPNSKNQLKGHWGNRQRRKQADMQMIGTYAVKCSVPRATQKRHVTLEIIKGGSGRLPDADNFWESTLDALKRLGYIVDDSEEWCDWDKPKIYRGKETMTVITLRDI